MTLILPGFCMRGGLRSEPRNDNFFQGIRALAD